MSKLVSIVHPGNARMLREAQRRDLKIEWVGNGCYAVSSFSEPSKWHAVEVTRQDYTCSCRATEYCSHGALATATEYEDVYVKWMNQLDDELRDFRVQIYRGELSARQLAAVIRRGQRAARRLAAQGFTLPTFESPMAMETDAVPF